MSPWDAYVAAFEIPDEELANHDPDSIEHEMIQVRDASSDRKAAEVIRWWGGWGAWQPFTSATAAARELRRLMGEEKR